MANFATLIRLTWASLSGRRVRCLFVLFFVSAMAMEKSLIPYCIRFLIDSLSKIEDKSNLSLLYIPLGIIIATLVASEVCYRISTIVMSTVYPYVQANMRRMLYKHTLHNPLQFFSPSYIGAVGGKLFDLPLCHKEVMRKIIEVFLPITITLVVMAVLMCTVSHWVGIAYIAWIILHMTAAIAINHRGILYSRNHAKTLHKLQGLIVDSLINILHVKLSGNYCLESRAYEERQNEEMESNRKSYRFMEQAKVGLFAIVVTEFTAMLLLGIYQWSKDLISTGDLVFILQGTVTTVLLIWWFALETSGLMQDIGRCLQAASLIEEPNESDTEGKIIKITKGAISYHRIDFAYDGGIPVFRDFCLDIKGGETIAVIGQSGSGKTTMINLLLRSYKPQSGSIMIDGEDISKFSLRSLRENISVIPQSVTLFNRSILDNILYGKPSASIDEVHDVAQKAMCHDFIESLPKGYDSIYGDDVGLSSGQCQRILMARAMLKLTPIIIFDEATSALDAITELYVRDAIKNLVASKTAIIIAHRLSTIAIADRVLVVNKGIIVACDTPQALENNKFYRELVDAYMIH